MADLDVEERQVELESVMAVFPEMVLDPRNNFAASVEIPVVPIKPATVFFAQADDFDAAHMQNGIEITYFPSLHLRLILGDGYPSSTAPIFELSLPENWLPKHILTKLEKQGLSLWEDLGRDLVVYSYIDHLQQEAEGLFGQLACDNKLVLSHELRTALISYNNIAKRADFERKTFDCGFCLEPKRGKDCHRMIDCGHVFCLSCLQHFYNGAINEGSVNSVACGAPDCVKNRKASRKQDTSVIPNELLAIGISLPTVKRYIRLKYKIELESDKDTVYCPIPRCGGAARNDRHKRMSLLARSEEKNGEPSTKAAEKKPAQSSDSGDEKPLEEEIGLLAICEDCSYAFCRRCMGGWHGIDFRICRSRRAPLAAEISADEKATRAYLTLHSTPCPTCNAPVQKSEACNHMICSRCETHFCYLCGSVLDVSNPYQHFNKKGWPCYQRLWELQEGDGEGPNQRRNDDEIAAAMAEEDDNHHPPQPGAAAVAPAPNRPGQANRVVAEPAPEPEPVVPAVPQVPAHGVVEREAALVLRLQLPAPAPVPVQLPNQAERDRQARQNQRGRGGFRGRGGVARGHPAQRGRGQAGGHLAAANYVPNLENGRVRQVAVERGVGNGRGLARGGGRIRVEDPVIPERAGAQPPPLHAWVQQFVALAMEDREDEVEWSSGDEDDGEWAIPERE